MTYHQGECTYYYSSGEEEEDIHCRLSACSQYLPCLVLGSRDVDTNDGVATVGTRASLHACDQVHRLLPVRALALHNPP
jgi:hypothetical protein